MNQFIGGPYNPEHGHGAYKNPGWVAIPQQQSFKGTWEKIPQPRLPFLPMPNLSNLSNLMNNPMCHDLSWPSIPNKIPSDIPKFEGRTGEDPGDHVTTFHLWFPSNSLNDDSIQLIFFQRTLMGVAMKCYINIPRGAYRTFNQLVLFFLNHFQLSVCYNAGI
jgi:hypothetical protein